MCYNDLGNFIGRIAHSQGLKYGQEGLWYNHYIHGKNYNKVFISKDYEEIFNYLDLDYKKFKKGFDNLKEIFIFVSKSKFFNPEMFQMKSLNKINRERNLKRKSYMSFLEWIEETYGEVTGCLEYREVVPVNIKELHNTFPDAKIKLQIAEMEYEYATNTLIKQKFNGGEIMKRFGLKGSDLGLAIEGYKMWVARHKGDFNQYVLKTDDELIYTKFGNYLNEFHLSYLNEFNKKHK